MPTEYFSNSEYEAARRGDENSWWNRSAAQPSQATTQPQSLASLTGLIDQINQIDQAAQQRSNAGRIPGGAGLEAQSSGNISSALAGQLDPSVLQQLGQQSAERGIMTGSPNGPGTNSDYLRSLGLTSLDLMDKGQGWLTAADARNPGAPIYSAGNQVLTAAQQQQALLEQQRLAQQQDQFQQELAFKRSITGGGGGGYRGGGGGGTETVSGPGPSINWGDMFDTRTITYPSAGGGAPTGGTNGSWFDNLLWDNASDLTGGGSTGFNPSGGNWWDDPFALD